MVPAAAIAGAPPLPTPGDKQLGNAGGIAYVSDTERENGEDNAFAYAACPDVGNRWRLIGGGVMSNSNPALIKDSIPSDLSSIYGDDDPDPDDYWEVRVDGNQAGRKFKSYAVCAKLKRADYVKEFVAGPLSAPATVTSPCLAGLRPSGGGGGTGALGDPIGGMYPDGNAWTITIADAITMSDSLTNALICVPPKGIRLVIDSFNVGSLRARTGQARCRGGRHVTGGGVQVPVVGDATPFSSHPADTGDRGKVPDDAWEIGVRSETTSRQQITVYAICRG